MFWAALTAKTKYLVDGLAKAAADAGIPVSVESEGGMFGLVFTDQGPVRSYDQGAAADTERFKAFFHGMLDEGVYFAPSAFEAGFVSAAHSDDDLDQTIAAATRVFPEPTSPCNDRNMGRGFSRSDPISSITLLWAAVGSKGSCP